MAEHAAVNRGVVGSSPTWAAIFLFGGYMEYEAHFSKDFDQLLTDIKLEYKYLENVNKNLQYQINTFNADSTIQELKNRIESIRNHSLLIMSDNELQQEKEFREEHWNKCGKPLNNKAKGNTYIYELINTGIGTSIKITCPICGECKNITDVDSW